jgi:hypothetical protein
VKKLKVLSIINIIILFSSCSNKDRVVEKFSKEKPYAIQIAKERSFYQADKLTSRLLDMEIDAYMINYLDSIANDGKWYYILCDNIEILDSAKSMRNQLEKQFDLKDLKIVDFDKFKNAVFQLDSIKLKEKKKIISNKPNVNEDIFKVINKFPESNSLLVQKTFVLNTPSDPENMKAFSTVFSFQMDLPRGISKKLILKNTTAFSEVIYKDNLYGDKVTIDIGKLRIGKPSINHASIININNNESFEIAEEYANLILETGDYLFEEKTEIEINSYTKLYGYKVTIEPKKNYFRTYLILVDKSNQYIIFSQSTDKSEKELIDILSDIGQGNGLLNYDEFYNTFYTTPENIVDNDLFIGFTIDKLDWSYAKNRNYVKWSKEMVGHWNATGYFHNIRKGIWTYSIFDLLTADNQDYIYGGLYSNSRSKNKYEVNVYGTNGFVIYKEKMNWQTYKSYKKTHEISFGIDRYVSAVNNSENSWLSKDELLERAESLQFEKISDSTSKDKPII